jgi:glycosyltransferase involved in cell wall biosynthesis
MICFSAQDWWYFNRAHSDFQLLTRVARDQPVLLVNSLGMRMPRPGVSTRPAARIARKLASVTRGLRRPLPDTPGFAVLTPLFLPIYTPGRARDLSNYLVRKQVELAARRLGITDPALMVTLPTAWEAAQPMRRSALIANRSDRYSAFGEADETWVAGLERDLLEHADVAVYASQSLMDAESDLTTNAVFLDHGVDLDRFVVATDIEPAPAIAAIARPRIGFFGAIDDYTVDLPLLRRIATEIPEAQLVLVGPTNCSLDDLVELPNVHWLGACTPDEVPAFGAGFDVALMPWLTNEWIAHCNPIKVKEYLALGLPIVSTYYPDVERYRSLLRVAGDADAFVALVRQTLADGGPATAEHRRAAVSGDSWDRRATELLDLVDVERQEVTTCAGS